MLQSPNSQAVADKHSPAACRLVTAGVNDHVPCTMYHSYVLEGHGGGGGQCLLPGCWEASNLPCLGQRLVALLCCGSSASPAKLALLPLACLAALASALSLTVVFLSLPSCDARNVELSNNTRRPNAEARAARRVNRVQPYSSMIIASLCPPMPCCRPRCRNEPDMHYMSRACSYKMHAYKFIPNHMRLYIHVTYCTSLRCPCLMHDQIFSQAYTNSCQTSCRST